MSYSHILFQSGKHLQMTFEPAKNEQEGEYSDNLRLDDDRAFEAFFNKHFLPLCSYCQYKFGFNFDLSKEIVHTGFIRLWGARQNLAVDLSPLTYLHTIIMNAGLDMLRHEKVKQKHVQFIQQTAQREISQNSFDSIDVKQLQFKIHNAIADLPDQCRLIFELSRFDGLKYAEIATRLNISEKTVETQMSRALKKLREKLLGYLPCGFILLIFMLLENS